MLPSSHRALRNPAPAGQNSLAEGFSAFIAASSRLESCYRELQGQVAELQLTLAERNRALDESRSRHRRLGLTLERILEAIPCGVLIRSAEGVVRLANPEAARLLALSAAQLPSASSAWMENGAAPGVELPGGPDGAEQEFSFQSSAGRHWLAVRRMPLPSECGAEDAVVTLQDISARKRAEQEREDTRDALALAQVSAMLAHEIRNPLASLELFAGLIEQAPEQGEEWIGHLRAGIRSLSGTVNNVLALHGGGTLPLARVELGSELRAAVNFAQPLARQAEVSLEMQWPSESPACWCLGERSALQQILLNLIANALRHTAAGKTVTVRLVPMSPASPERGIQVLVEDQGCGISDEHQRHIFKSGFSGSGTTPGLGLAVCERLMRQHGGSIQVQSELGHGSTFLLEFQPA